MANLRLTAADEWGAEGQQVQFFRVTKPWATNSVTWNNMLNPQGWDGNSGSPLTAIPAGTGPGTQVTFDVTSNVRSWYTRRGPDWRPQIGLLLKFLNEGASYGEVAWKKGDANTPLGYQRPLLMINYVVPRPEFDFAPLTRHSPQRDGCWRHNQAADYGPKRRQWVYVQRVGG